MVEPVPLIVNTVASPAPLAISAPHPSSHTAARAKAPPAPPVHDLRQALTIVLLRRPSARAASLPPRQDRPSRYTVSSCSLRGRGIGPRRCPAARPPPQRPAGSYCSRSTRSRSPQRRHLAQRTSPGKPRASARPRRSPPAASAGPTIQPRPQRNPPPIHHRRQRTRGGLRLLARNQYQRLTSEPKDAPPQAIRRPPRDHHRRPKRCRAHPDRPALPLSRRRSRPSADLPLFPRPAL
jgi:hypothetical protein